MAAGTTGTGETQWLTILMGIFALASPFVIFAITGIRTKLASLESRIDSVVAAANTERTSMEQRLAAQIKGALEAQHESEKTIWEAIDKERKSVNDFRERILREMVTKTDLDRFRSDLKDHITSTPRPPDGRR